MKSNMEKRIRVRIGTVLNDNRIDILSEDGDSLLHDLCRVIEQELDRAREEVMFTEDEQRVLRFALKLQRDDIHKVWDEETFGTIWKKVGGLSKLTTK